MPQIPVLLLCSADLTLAAKATGLVGREGETEPGLALQLGVVGEGVRE